MFEESSHQHLNAYNPYGCQSSPLHLEQTLLFLLLPFLLAPRPAGRVFIFS